MKLVLNIEPKPQSRPRFSRWGTYDDPKMKIWRKKVTNYIVENYDDIYFDDAVSVAVTFYMTAPQSISKEPTKRSKQKTKDRFRNFIYEKIWHTKKPDLDNLIKAIFDSITDSEVIWTDDNIVCHLEAKKIYSPNPRIEIQIEYI